MNHADNAQAPINTELSGAEAIELETLRARVANPTAATTEEVVALHKAENGEPGFLEKPFLGFKSVTNGDVVGGTLAVAAAGAVVYGAYKLLSRSDDLADTAFGGTSFVL